MNEQLNSQEALRYPSARDDFFLHVNGEWLDATEIPPEEARWGAFDIARDNTAKRLRGIAEQAQDYPGAEKGSIVQLVGDFYKSALDMETRNRLGAEPISEMLTLIDSAKDNRDVMRVAAELRLNGIGFFYSVYFDEDEKNAGHYALNMMQSGKGLPDREYYLSDDESRREIQEKYRAYMSTLFQKVGRTKEDADKAAQTVYDIEYALAEASIPEADARDVDTNYFKYTLDQAKAEFPDVDWDMYFSTLGKPDIKEFVIRQPQFIRKVNDILRDTDTQSIKDYQEASLLVGMAGSLSEDFVDENFKFTGQLLYGLEEPTPLWKETIGSIDSADGTVLWEAIGPMYCKEYFDTEAKAKVLEIVSDVTDAFRDMIEVLDWMTPETKELTLKKLDNIVFKMGFPENWQDLSELDIRSDSLVENLMNSSKFSFSKQLARLEEPFDFEEWLMAPTEVNACSDLKREMTFPAAILQPPFYDPELDDAYSYGAIGGVVGHELSHFFDDQGCKFDLEGNARDWWNDQDRANFEALTQQFVEYFGSLIADGLQLDGKLTLGENIADFAGIKSAYYALQKKLAREGKREIVDGLTPEQRLFVGWARVWAKKVRPELAQRAILTDPHAPGEIRTNGVLAILPEFQEAFGVVPGDGMYVSPEDQPKLW